MLTSSTVPLKNLRPIKPLRRLRREIPMNNCSMEDYYHGGVSISVPFQWESEPGTPKVRFQESTLPPLTPPPHYYSGNLKSSVRQKPDKSNLFGSIFPKRTTNRKKNHPTSLASSSSSSSSSSPSPSPSETLPWSTSYSVPLSPMRPSNYRGSYDSRAQEEEDSGAVSSLRFARSRGCCYSSLIKYCIKILNKSSSI